MGRRVLSQVYKPLSESGGGTKKRQARDIAKAQIRWKAYKQEKRNARKRT